MFRLLFKSRFLFFPKTQSWLRPNLGRVQRELDLRSNCVSDSANSAWNSTRFGLRHGRLQKLHVFLPEVLLRGLPAGFLFLLPCCRVGSARRISEEGAKDLGMLFLFASFAGESRMRA